MHLLLAALLSITAQASPNSEALYNGVTSPVYEVQYREGEAPILGSVILEKSNDELVCQRISATVPNAPANYLCWERIFSGEEAKLTYDATDAIVLTVDYSVDGAPLVGYRVEQRGLPSGFCRRESAVVPKPVYKYSCFNRLP